MYSDYVLSFGYLIAAIVLCAVVTGVAGPVLKRAGVSVPAALIWAVGVILLAAVDGGAGGFFMLVPAMVYFSRIDGWLWSAAAFLSMLAMGALMFGVMGVLGATSYGGLAAGVLASGLSLLLGEKNQVLCVALGGAAMALLVSFVLEGAWGLVAPVAQTAYFDAGVTAAVCSVLICALRSEGSPQAA